METLHTPLSFLLQHTEVRSEVLHRGGRESGRREQGGAASSRHQILEDYWGEADGFLKY